MESEEDEEEEEEEEEEKGEECPICTFELGEVDGQEAFPVCGHVFHSACIGEWRATCVRKHMKVTCPYCRQAM